jgi:hypothetical protein
MIGYYRRSLIDLFTKLHRLSKNPLQHSNLALEIQEALIVSVTRLENRIRKARALRREIKQILATRNSKEQATQYKEEVERIDNAIVECQRIKSIYRDIGDGLAFLYIDRWDVKPMVFKEPAGSITNKTGARLERKVFREAFKKGHIAILNDITHSLRYGDVTVLNHGGQCLLLELKSGKSSNQRCKRQTTRLDKLVQYLRDDKITGLYAPEQEMKRVALSVAEKGWQEQLNTGIEIALREGEWIGKIEDGLHCVVDTGASARLLADTLKSLDSPPMVTFLNLFKGEVQGYFPLVLSLTNPEALFKFYEGTLLITVLICPDAIDRILRIHGFSSTLIEDDVWKLAVTDLTEPSKPKFKISSHFLNRVAFEFLSLGGIIESLIEKLKIWKNPEDTASF